MSEGSKEKITMDNIPVDGSLGILAIGYRGIMAWREARKNAGIDIVEIRRKEYEIRKAEMEEKKAEFEKKKAELEAERKKEEENKKK